MAAITVFVIFLVKWNSTLENEAKKKAQQLYESERKARELENSYDAVKQYLDEVLEELHRKPVHSQGYLLTMPANFRLQI
jgi:geranylgeranyl pyrophosphate synthase